MANCCNQQYQKSSARTYNSTTQTVTSALTQLNILGSACTDTGCSMTISNSAINITNSGLYYLAADVTFTPTAAGTEIVQLYSGSTALPCAIAQFTGTVGSAQTVHVETVLNLSACNAVQPSINVKVSGAAGGVNFVGMTAIRLA